MSNHELFSNNINQIQQPN